MIRLPLIWRMKPVDECDAPDAVTVNGRIYVPEAPALMQRCPCGRLVSAQETGLTHGGTCGACETRHDALNADHHAAQLRKARQ